MTAYITSLRVNIDQLRSEGMDITVLPRIDCDCRKYIDYANKREPVINHVSEAVKEYLALDPKPRGCLTQIARKHNTTGGAILNKIRRSADSTA